MLRIVILHKRIAHVTWPDALRDAFYEDCQMRINAELLAILGRSQEDLGTSYRFIEAGAGDFIDCDVEASLTTNYSSVTANAHQICECIGDVLAKATAQAAAKPLTIDVVVLPRVVAATSTRSV